MLNFQQQQIDEFRLHPFLLSLISLFSIYILTKWLFKNSSKKIVPPSPPKLPVLGNFHQLSWLLHRSLQSLGRKYGPVMLIHFGSRPVIVVQSADAAMEIMKIHDLEFANKPITYTIRRLFYNLKDITVAPYGEYWRKLKSICILHLLSNKMVQSFQFIREEETTLLMKKIETCSLTGSPVNLSEMLISLTNDVMGRSAFGRKYTEGEGGENFLMLLRELMQLSGSVSIGEFIPCLSWIGRVNGFYARVDKVAKEVDHFLDQVIQEYQSTGPARDDIVMGERRENFVNILLKICDDNTSNVSIDRDTIKAIILDVFVGGTDTETATLVWAMTELLRHPVVMKKLQNEIREIIRGKQDIINDNDLEKMHYLKAVVKETLRYHTPNPILAREAREDAKVMQYEVEAGTMILINAWAIGRDPAYWDEPEKFKPERFLNSSIDFMGLDFELIPFGAGRRRCPGITFAMANVEIVLANLLQKFNWELPQGMKIEDLDTLELPGGTMHIKNPLFAVASYF